MGHENEVTQELGASSLASVVLASAKSQAACMYISADVFWWMRNHEGICFAHQVETWQLFVIFVTCHLIFHEVIASCYAFEMVMRRHLI